MESDRAHSSAVVLERAIWFLASIEVEPAHATILAADDQVIAARMDGERRDPLHTRGELLDEFLLSEIVQSDVYLKKKKPTH